MSTVLQKPTALQNAQYYSGLYTDAKQEAQVQREALVDSIEIAHKQAGATQLEIAEATGFSRQRIAQFLKERNDGS